MVARKTKSYTCGMDVIKLKKKKTEQMYEVLLFLFISCLVFSFCLFVFHEKLKKQIFYCWAFFFLSVKDGNGDIIGPLTG